MAAGDRLVDVVNDLSKEYQVGIRALYLDWQNRQKWLPVLLAIDNRQAFFLDLFNTHKELKRLARLQFLQADSSSAAVGALKLLRDLNLDMFELLGGSNLIKTAFDSYHNEVGQRTLHGDLNETFASYGEVFDELRRKRLQGRS
jgi:hypothetical protein